ncbi:uncharacterized protein LOC110111772 [Dendrobium catenatum]|uniref:uncharacterized protein LOC110111772 n=1 Tax=Dendrobium catenatum TaxID=906689 RepID=UPI00109FCAE3|nr:uncharacterized protein LOC110111772 [Dendrobium catenatum]
MVLWRKDLANFSVLEASSQMIVGKLTVAGKGSWVVASVYGSNVAQIRRRLWTDLEKYCSSDLPFIVGGDFNCMISQEEKRGGKKFLVNQGSKDFTNFMISNDLHEVKSMGPKFTWCNNKNGGAHILEKLDRCLINTIAMNHIQITFVKHLSRVASDHCLILLEVFKPLVHSKKMIRHSSNWISHIKSGYGSYLEDESEIQKTITDFFRLKWKFRECNLEGWPNPSSVLNVEDQRLLEVDFCQDELQLVVDSFKRNISPGVDGISFSFIKDFWEIIKEDIWLAVKQFFISGNMDESWKETMIILIPKIKNRQELVHYRPISLCLTVYKLIAKIVLNRMEKVIHKIISND